MRTLPQPRPRALLAIVSVAVALLLTACLSGEQQRLVDSVTWDRVARGRSALVVNDQLTTKAQGWAERMARDGRISHSNLTSGVPGCWRALGENVARAGSVDGLHRAWMGSPPHRANILSWNYTHIGVGVARRGSSYYGVQVFMRAC